MKGPLVTRPAPAYSDVQLMTCQPSGYWAVSASLSWACTGSSIPVTASQTSATYLGRRVHVTQSLTLNRLPHLGDISKSLARTGLFNRVVQLPISRLRDRLGWDLNSLQPNWHQCHLSQLEVLPRRHQRTCPGGIQVRVPSVHTARSIVTPSSATALVVFLWD